MLIPPNPFGLGYSGRYAIHLSLECNTSIDSEIASLALSDPLASNWTIDEILASLPSLTRVDDGCDLLAARVAGGHPTRTAYVYLYGYGIDSISFDLEDQAVENEEWDHAIRRGCTESLNVLRRELLQWLSEKDA